MKRFASVLLAVVLMLSLSVFSFADTLLQGGDPFDPSLNNKVVPYNLTRSVLTGSQGIYYMTGRETVSRVTFTQAVQDGDLYIGSGAILTYNGQSTGSDYQRCFSIGRALDYLPYNDPHYWWNLIIKITDANGYVLKTSDFDQFGVQLSSISSVGLNMGHVDPASDNCYQFSDGYIQVALERTAWEYSNESGVMYLNVSNSSVVAPLTFELEVCDVYSGEAESVKPFPFGPDAHSTTPPGPKDPNDASQYGDAEDQVEWYNDAFGGAVDPELGDRMDEATDILLQEQEIEDQVISGLNQYSSQVDPAILTFPTQIVNGLSFIGTTFMSSYNALGDIGFVISLSMMLGVVLVLIGRGEGALARGMAASARDRRRTEYASKRDMDKGG